MSNTQKTLLLLSFNLFAIASCTVSKLPDKNVKTQTLEIIFGGDIDFGDRYHLHKNGHVKNCILKEKGYANSFDSISPLLHSTELLVANLETPISGQIEKNPLEGKKKYLHWCQAEEAVAVLEKFDFDYLSLANNHSLDQGIAGIETTFNHLTTANIEYFGAGKTADEASKPMIIEDEITGRKLYILGGFQYRSKYRRVYDFYATADKTGVNKWTKKEAERQIKQIKETDPTGFIIAFPHWGENYKWKDEKQEALGAVLIDAGADLVIGHGTHKFQEIEQVKGKWIFYNLGNLVMNSTGRYEQENAMPYSFILKLKLVRTQSGIEIESNIYPIVSNNKLTAYQPHFVSKIEMELLKSTLIEKTASLRKKIKIRQDDIGYFFSLKLN